MANTIKLTLNEAEQVYLRVLRDWQFARARNETDWRSYAMIANDAESALDDFRQAVRRELQHRRETRRLPARAGYEMACAILYRPMRGEIVRILNSLPADYLYCPHGDLWYHKHNPPECAECEAVRAGL